MRVRLGPVALLGLAVLLLVACAAAGLLLGSDRVSIGAALEGPGVERTILLRYRLPHVLLAGLAGGGLAVVGGAFQALLRNPLAEPWVLGVSGGAAVGATVVIALGIGASTLLGAALTPLAALAGGLGATAIVYAVARRAAHGTGSESSAGATILLAGIMINAIASALVTFAKLLVPPSRAQQMLRWLVGFVELPTPTALVLGSAYVFVGVLLLWRDAARVNLLSLGDEQAASLGVEVRALERRVFLAASCVVGAIVSLTGLIAFVGLMVPHLVRRVAGPDLRLLLPASFVTGAALLVACDVVARMAFDLFGQDLPVGAVTAAIGGPIFLWMLMRAPVARAA